MGKHRPGISDNNMRFFVLAQLARSHRQDCLVRTGFQVAKALEVKSKASIIHLFTELRDDGLIIDDLPAPRKPSGVPEASEASSKVGRHHRPARLTGKGITEFRERAKDWLNWASKRKEVVEEGVKAVGE